MAAAKMVAMQFGCVLLLLFGHLHTSDGQFTELEPVSVSSADQGYCASFNDYYGIEQQGFNCPQEYDLPSETYCCGGSFRYCCDYDTYRLNNKVNLDFNWNNNNNTLNDLVNDFTEIGNTVATGMLTIVGVICGIIALIILIVVIVAVLVCTGLCCRSPSTHNTTIIRNSAPPPTAVVTSSQMYAPGPYQTTVYQVPAPAYYPPQQQQYAVCTPYAYAQAPSSTAYTVKI